MSTTNGPAIHAAKHSEQGRGCKTYKDCGTIRTYDLVGVGVALLEEVGH